MEVKISFTESSIAVTAKVEVSHDDPEKCLELSKKYFDEAKKYAELYSMQKIQTKKKW